jgi:hypothetical protein
MTSLKSFFMKKIEYILMMAAICCVAVSAAAGPYDVPKTIPDTGQTQCYDTAGNVIPCPSEGEDYYCQDANYTINPMSFTKLGYGVVELPYTATFDDGWIMTKDNVTGLTWEVKQDKDTDKNYDNPHDAENTYTWYDPDPDTNGGYEGTQSDHDTLDFITELNNSNFGGYSNWRMPSRVELRSIVDYSIPFPGPAVNSVFFPNTIASCHWTSTTSAYGTSIAWHECFQYGGSGYSSKSYDYYVRAVCGEQPDQDRLVDNGNGTVTDTRTGLTWEQKTDDGGPRDKDNRYTWKEAMDYCEDLDLGGHTDWRLPTIKELSALVDLSRCIPSIDTSVFSNTSVNYINL